MSWPLASAVSGNHETSNIENEKNPTSTTHQYSVLRSRSVLQNLPLELLLDITTLLPPVYIISLSYTCRHFRQSLDFRVEEMLRAPKTHKSTSTSTRKSRAIKSQRLELLCLLDRDDMIPQDKLICSACTTTHSKSLFSQESLDRDNTERQCVGTMGRIWVCPHFKLNHKQMRHRKSRYARQPHGFCWACEHYVYLSDHSSQTIFPILCGSDDSDLQDGNVTRVLNSLHAAICPHMRLSHPAVSNVYAQHRCHRRSENKCLSCDTAFKFDELKCCDGPRVLRVIVERRFEIHEATAPKWINQLVQPSQFKRLKQEWNATSEYCHEVIESEPFLSRTSCQQS